MSDEPLVEESSEADILEDIDLAMASAPMDLLEITSTITVMRSALTTTERVERGAATVRAVRDINEFLSHLDPELLYIDVMTALLYLIGQSHYTMVEDDPGYKELVEKVSKLMANYVAASGEGEYVNAKYDGPEFR